VLAADDSCMLRAIARLLILRILPRRLVPILTLYEAYRIYRNYRRRQHQEAISLGARPANEAQGDWMQRVGRPGPPPQRR
jgi:hypothetical protein